MKKRVISAAIMIAIILPLVIIGKIPFAIFVGLVSVMAFKEMSDLYDYPLPVKITGFLALITLVYSNFDANNIFLGLNYSIIGIVILLVLTPIVFYQIKGKYSTEDAFKMLGFILLIGLGLNYFILIRAYSLKYFMLMVLTPIITDTFAYVGGSLIGKHKVTKLSPNKSWEGYVVGSLMGTFMMSMYYFSFINPQGKLLQVILIIFLMTVVGQIGDLFFSAIKRKHNIKDFSNLIPGHGGVLDRLDSLIFVAIIFMIFIERL